MGIMRHYQKYRNIIENFGDPNAVVQEYEDENGNLQKVEIFYGGKTGGDSYGHGHWVANNIDGYLQVVLDRSPDNVDGGKHQIENNHKTDAYNDERRRERIRQKEAVIAELSYLNATDRDLVSKVKELREKLYKCGSCGHDDNTRLKDLFESRVELLFAERKREQQYNKDRKESVVRQAENLLSYGNDYKSAIENLKRLKEEFRSLPRASRDEEERLWERFKRAEESIYQASKREYEQRKQQQAVAVSNKERIISQAESLVYSSDYRSASEEMKRLSDAFYNAGNAGKDNQRLKDQFNSVKERFYEAKRRAGEQRHREHMQKLQEVLQRKKERVSRLENVIYNKESQLSDLLMRPDPSYNNPNRWDIVANRNRKISEIQASIVDLKQTVMSINNEIYDLQSKIR